MPSGILMILLQGLHGDSLTPLRANFTIEDLAGFLSRQHPGGMQRLQEALGLVRNLASDVERLRQDIESMPAGIAQCRSDLTVPLEDNVTLQEAKDRFRKLAAAAKLAPVASEEVVPLSSPQRRTHETKRRPDTGAGSSRDVQSVADNSSARRAPATIGSESAREAPATTRHPLAVVACTRG
jgi:hypothetical protein